MANAHVRLPKPFASGNVHEWFMRFNICSDANEWGDERKALRLSSPYAVGRWSTSIVAGTQRGSKNKAKEEILAAMMSMRLEIPAEKNCPRWSAASVPAQSKAATGASHARTRRQATIAASVCGRPSLSNQQAVTINSKRHWNAVYGRMCWSYWPRWRMNSWPPQ